MSVSTERPDIAAAYMGRIKELVKGKRIMPAVEHPERENTGLLHLSDLDLCLNQTYFRRTVPPEIRQGIGPSAEGKRGACVYHPTYRT